MRKVVIALLLIAVLNHLCAQASKKGNQTCHLVFQHTVGTSLLHTDSVYTNRAGEAFRVRSFKYYISHLQLLYENGTVYSLPLLPHLIDERDSASKQLSFSAPSGKIKGINFLLGVDSITNVSGVQTGDLDPAKGMFWIWNTGYIMSKLEGTSPASKAPGRQFSYDIGGYQPNEKVTREINLLLPLADTKSSHSFVVSADAGKWFYGTSNISIAEHPMCHAPGALAVQIANNYAGMFSLRAE